LSKVSLERENKRKEGFKEKQKRIKRRKELSPLDTLNEEQLKAVYSPHKSNLIIASAGTGKTSTIIGRVLHLLDNGYKPNEIILLTFTSKAGKEMIERLSKHFSEEIVSQIFAGTFHSYGKSLMNKCNDKTKLKTKKDMISLISSLMEDSFFVQSFTEPFSASVINDYISLYENTRHQEEFSEWLENTFIEKINTSKSDASISRLRGQIETLEIYQELYDRFVQSKHSHGLCDFNDLLLFISVFYKANNNIIRQIIVDEYQDTNTLQNKILQQLAKQGSGIFAVGDYDQSIYGFNGSNIEIIREFPKKYNDVGVYKLVKNYRSSKAILTIANNCISHNERIIPKGLVAMKSGVFAEPKLIVFNKLTEQYHSLPTLIKESGYDINDVAILFRSNNSGNMIEAILVAEDIPVVRVNSNSFFDGQDIATLISVYRIIREKKNVTVLDFINLNNFISGLNRNQLKVMFENSMHNESIIDGINSYIENNKHIIQSPHVEDFIRLLNDARGLTSPFTIFRLIFDTPCYTNLFDNTVEVATKFNKNASLDEVIELVEKKHELLLAIAKNCSDTREFEMKLNFSSKEEDNEYGAKLLTIHASKGLEFKSVFIVDLTEEKFPNLKLAGDDGIDEERRLFYVAVTRAEESLVLISYKSNDTKKKPKEVKCSRFVAESGINT